MPKAYDYSALHQATLEIDLISTKATKLMKPELFM